MALFKPNLQKKLKKSHPEKISYVFGNGTFWPHIFLLFQEGTFPAQKAKKKEKKEKHFEKVSYISGNGTF